MALAVAPHWVFAKDKSKITRPIPSSGELLAIMGMGTSRTFDVELDAQTLRELTEVLQAFFDGGGQLIDSSPMYGAAETVIGKTLAKTTNKKGLFTATKVWTDGKQAGIGQMKQSARRMGVKTIDLMQIHNLRDWRTHLPTLRQWKAEKKIRYIGITTSHGRQHQELKKVLESEPFDFVQLSYNIIDREAEKELLPLAQEKGIATLINRPFQRGDLFRRVKGKPLPKWAAEFDCESWAQFFLKFVAAHPATTCLIPATSKRKHMVDNMGAGYGRLPDANMRKKMIAHIESL